MSPRGSSATLGVSVTCGNSTPPPTPWQDPMGFLPLRRTRGTPPRPPLQGTHGLLRRPCVPCCCPAVPRFHLPVFPTCLRTSPFVSASPHGGPTLSPRWRLRRGLSLFLPLSPSLPQVDFPRHFLVFSKLLPSVSLFPTPPTPRLSTPPLSPILSITLIPRSSTPRSCIRFPPGRPPLCGTFPLHRR